MGGGVDAKLSNMLCTKVIHRWGQSCGFNLLDRQFRGLGGLAGCELHVRKLLTLWISRVDNGRQTLLEVPGFPRNLTNSVKFSTSTLCWTSESDPQHFTGCALSYPQVWMKL